MLGKVSMQPSVGHWKVLPAKRDGAESAQPQPHCTPCGSGGTHQHVSVPSRALPTAGWGNAASPRGAGTLRASCAVSPSFKPCFSPSHPNTEHPGAITGRPGAHHPPYPQGIAWVCSGPSGGPSAPACWGRPVCSRSWSRRSASLEGDTALALAIAQPSPAASPPPCSAHLRPVCASAAAGPARGLLQSPLPAWGRQAEPLHCSLWGRGRQAADASALCSRHAPTTLGPQPRALELGRIQAVWGRNRVPKCSCVVGPKFLFANVPVPVPSFLPCTNGYLTWLGQFGALGGGLASWSVVQHRRHVLRVLLAGCCPPGSTHWGPSEGSVGHPHGGHQQPL